ncbi:Uncharacterised protein [Actinomadura madurae]|nr:Uncharacterised protein [Actinomadura madurae]
MIARPPQHHILPAAHRAAQAESQRERGVLVGRQRRTAMRQPLSIARRRYDAKAWSSRATTAARSSSTPSGFQVDESVQVPFPQLLISSPRDRCPSQLRPRGPGKRRPPGSTTQCWIEHRRTCMDRTGCGPSKAATASAPPVPHACWSRSARPAFAARDSPGRLPWAPLEWSRSIVSALLGRRMSSRHVSPTEDLRTCSVACMMRFPIKLWGTAWPTTGDARKLRILVVTAPVVALDMAAGARSRSQTGRSMVSWNL